MNRLLISAGLAIGLSAPLFAAESVNYKDETLIKQGEYLARAGDCVACHTASGGKPFAGGLPMESPVGTIFPPTSHRINKPVSVNTALKTLITRYVTV